METFTEITPTLLFVITFVEFFLLVMLIYKVFFSPKRSSSKDLFSIPSDEADFTDVLTSILHNVDKIKRIDYITAENKFEVYFEDLSKPI